MMKGEKSKGLLSVSPLKLSLKWDILTWKDASQGYDTHYTRRPEDTFRSKNQKGSNASISTLQHYQL